MQIIWSQISADCSPEPFRLQSVTPTQLECGNIRIGRAIIWDVVKACMNQPKERICGEILASFGCNKRHGNPRQEDITVFR